MSKRMLVRIFRARWESGQIEAVMAGPHLIRGELDACYETEDAVVDEFEGWLEWEEIHE